MSVIAAFLELQVACMEKLAVVFQLRWPINLFGENPKITIGARSMPDFRVSPALFQLLPRLIRFQRLMSWKHMLSAK
jgi:hypothetical protein